MTTLLSGKLYSCDLGHSMLTYAQQAQVATKWQCLNYGGEWINATLNFDDTLRGMLTLFIFSTREGWVGLMEDSVDAVGVDFVGKRGNNFFYILLYMLLVIALCLLFINMIVRVVIMTYNTQKDFISFNSLLTDQQRSWIQVQIMTYSYRPKMRLQTTNTRNCLRNLCLKVS